MHASTTIGMPGVAAGTARRGERRADAASARAEARLAGALWLVVIFTGAFSFFAVSSLTVQDDAAATVANITASETLFRLGFAANLVAGLSYLGVTVLLYRLLKPVSGSLSLLAASLGVVGVAAGAATGLLQLAPLSVLGDAPYLGALTAGEREALAMTFLSLAWQGSGVGMVFFGSQCMLIGALAARSRFIPRILGVLLAIGGSSYVAASFAGALAPAFGARLAPLIVPAALIGEGALSLWLVIRGVDAARWQEQAARQ